MVEQMEIILKKRFQSKLDKLLIYLNSEFGEKGVQTFRQSLLSGFYRIKKFPESGSPTGAEEIRSFRAGNHVRVYYKVIGQVIWILNLYDMRQNPSKNIYL